MAIDKKIKDAENVLKLAAEMSKLYYHAPLIICYSGGKDSDVLLNIALECLAPDDFEVLNSHTTVDAPETVYYIRDVFRELNDKGIKATIQLPRYKGKITSMWDLIVQKGAFPTSIMRFCCQVLKETSTPDRMAAVGVRADESINRRGRDVFGVLGRRAADAQYFGFEHVKQQFESSKQVTADLGDDPDTVNVYDCKFIETAKKNKDILISPIYEFTERDIWEYIHAKGLTVNPLYSRGYKRVGCIGCPLAGPVHMQKEFADYPKYKENYIRAFDRMIEKRKKEGRPLKCADNGAELMKLWLRQNPKQIDIFEMLDEGGDQ